MAMWQTTSQFTITKLRLMFATHRLPQVMVRQRYLLHICRVYNVLRENKICHLRIPYKACLFQQSRRMDHTSRQERAAKVARFRKPLSPGQVLDKLSHYAAVNSGCEPAELLMRHRLYTRLDLCNLHKHPRLKQSRKVAWCRQT